MAIRIDEIPKSPVFTWIQTWSVPTKKDKAAMAIIDAARDLLKSIQGICDNWCSGKCKKCDYQKKCDSGKLYRALRKYDKMAKREADRG